MGQIVYSRIKCAQGVGSRIVYIEGTNHQGWKRVILEQGRWADSAKGSSLEGEIIGIGYPEAGKLELKEALRGDYLDRQ